MIEVFLAAILLLMLVLGLTPRAEAADVLASSEVLEIELQKGKILRVDRPAATVFVADAAIADVETRSQRTIFIFGRKSGETTLYVLDSDDKPLLNVTVRVTHNLSRLQPMIRSIAPDSDVRVRSIEGGIVIEGEVENPQTAAQLAAVVQSFAGENETVLNRLSVTAPTQVNLRVRFAEVSREVLRLLGVTWSAQDLTDIDPLTGLAIPEKTKFNIFSTRPDITLEAEANTAIISQRIGPATLQATVDALEREGLISILAEPNLTAVSGETASFLAGGEFPIPVGLDDNEVAIAFKEFGVSLSFTPTVLSSNRISLRLRPEVSQLSQAGAIVLQDIQIPGLSTRRADTTIELASGQSFAIAGLIQNRETHDINKVPGLGDVPVLGQLFQSKNFQREETELVIIATPYLVRPIGAGEKPSGPTDYPAGDQQFERLLVSQLKKSAPNSDESAELANRKLSGPVGFMVD
ncbi:MAG: type II and III secretion system protein family protein [Alphaproteobacteria bacterium]